MQSQGRVGSLGNQWLRDVYKVQVLAPVATITLRASRTKSSKYNYLPSLVGNHLLDFLEFDYQVGGSDNDF